VKKKGSNWGRQVNNVYSAKIKKEIKSALCPGAYTGWTVK